MLHFEISWWGLKPRGQRAKTELRPQRDTDIPCRVEGISVTKLSEHKNNSNFNSLIL